MNSNLIRLLIKIKTLQYFIVSYLSLDLQQPFEIKFIPKDLPASQFNSGDL